MLRSFVKLSQCFLTKTTSLQSIKQLSNLSAAPITRVNSNILHKSFYGTKGETELVDVLKTEIKAERNNVRISHVPRDFTIKEAKGSEFTLQRKDDDGVIVEVKLDLAGSVGISEGEGENEDESAESAMEALPDFTISLIKPNKRTITFNCSLNVEPQELEGDEITPTYSVESVEVGAVPGYYSLSEVMDAKVFENLTELLIERGLNLDFQRELQSFCTGEEHKLYCKFLEELKQFCS